jgi:hypothetical protein
MRGEAGTYSCWGVEPSGLGVLSFGMYLPSYKYMCAYVKMSVEEYTRAKRGGGRCDRGALEIRSRGCY